MNRLFEQLIERALRVVVQGRPGWRLLPQAVDRTTLMVTPGGRSIAIRPDALVHKPNGHRVPIDAKYKRYDQRSVSADDIQQLALYAFANRVASVGRAVLIHPTDEPVVDRSVQVRDREGLVGSTIAVVGVSLARLVEELSTRTPGGPVLDGLRRHLDCPIPGL